jgi:hypothetical protein
MSSPHSWESGITDSQACVYVYVILVKASIQKRLKPLEKAFD